ITCGSSPSGRSAAGEGGPHASPPRRGRPRTTRDRRPSYWQRGASACGHLDVPAKVVPRDLLVFRTENPGQRISRHVTSWARRGPELLALLLKPLAIDLFLIGPVALVELRVAELRERSSGNGQKDAKQDAYNESSHDTPPR